MSKQEKAIIERIKKMMKKRQLTQEDLGQVLSLPQYGVSRLFSGKPFPSIDQLVLIANRLDCSLYYLLGVQEASYRELSKEAALVADAYSSSSEEVQCIVKRILDL
jgi:transcriptional regulator with XRE-family HTH domain